MGMHPPLIEYPENDEINFDAHGYPLKINMIKSTPSTPNGHHSVIQSHHHHQRHHSNHQQQQPMTQPTTPVMSGHGHHHTFHPQHIKHAQSHHNVLYEHPPSHQQHHSFPDIDFSSAPLLCEDIVDEVF